MPYINAPYAVNIEQSLLAANSTDYAPTTVIKSIKISNDDNVAIAFDLLLDGTVNTYILKGVTIPVGAAICLSDEIQYDGTTTALKIQATPASGTAAYSVSMIYKRARIIVR